MGFVRGWLVRAEELKEKIALSHTEEAGARDALSRAFEDLKKFEHVAEMARVADLKEQDRRETAALDEMGLRRASAP